MSQNAFNEPNEAGAAYRAGINAALQALATLSSGATAPTTTYPRMLWADTTNNLLKRRNAADSGWIVLCSLDETFIVSRSSNTVLGLSDYGKTFIATSSFTQTLTAAATLGDGWHCFYRNDGSGAIVLDPNASETINGATTITLQPGQNVRIVCNGSSLWANGSGCVDVQIFTSNGTWTKPYGARSVNPIVIGAGGPGGGGRGGAAATIRQGGSGGGGSMPMSGWFNASDLGATETITVGGGGTGGTGGSSANGNAGSGVGGSSSFGSWLKSFGGGPGAGGTSGSNVAGGGGAGSGSDGTSGGGGGQGGKPTQSGDVGGRGGGGASSPAGGTIGMAEYGGGAGGQSGSGPSANDGGTSVFGAGGGGCGGWVNASNTTGSPSGAFGGGVAPNFSDTGGGGSQGAAGGGAGGNGAAGSGVRLGAGGGGGGANTAGTGGTGGTGGAPGGGGGGGGGGTTTGGNGGPGGRGEVRVYTYF